MNCYEVVYLIVHLDFRSTLNIARQSGCTEHERVK